MVTVALRCSSIIAIGLPTMLLRPTTTASSAFQRRLMLIQHRHAPGRRARREARLADHQAADILDVKAVDVLLHGDGLQHLRLAHLLRAGEAAPECRGSSGRRSSARMRSSTCSSDAPAGISCSSRADARFAARLDLVRT